MTPAEDWQRLALWVASRYAGDRDADDLRQEALLGAWLGIQRVRAKGLTRCTDNQAAVKGAQWAISDYRWRGKRRRVNGEWVLVEEPASLEGLERIEEPATDGGIDAADLRLELWLHARRQPPPVARSCRFCGRSIAHRNVRARYCGPSCKSKAVDARHPNRRPSGGARQSAQRKAAA